MARHPLLDDDRFKIGFEFEFIMHSHEELLDEVRYVKACMMNYNTFKAAFDISKEQLEQIEAILSYGQHFTKNKFDAPDIDVEGEKFGIPKLIALFKLKPRNRKWYTNGNLCYYDRSDEINEALDNLDPNNYSEVKSLARRLSHYYIRARQLDNYGRGEQEDALLDRAGAFLGERLGVSFVTNEYDRDLIGDEFCLKTEYLDDADAACGVGLEITTPPLPPREAMVYAWKIIDIMNDRNIPFKVKLANDCGIHVNISHPDVRLGRVSPLYYSLMNDERALALPFRRVTQEACLPYTKNILEIARKLVKNKLIALDMLDTMEGLRYVVTMIESNLDYGKYASAYFYYMHKPGYIEYRMAGGKGYNKKYKELEHHVEECLRITKSFTEEHFDDWVFAHKVKTLLIEAGAKRGARVSFPREIFKRK